MEARRPSLIQNLKYDREYYFCFCGYIGNVPWYQKLYMRLFSHKFYKHVSLLAPLGDDAILFLEPTPDHIETHVMVLSKEKAIEELKGLGYLVIRYSHDISDSKIRCRWNLIPSCVTVVKVFSGVSAPALSPWGLAKWLLKQEDKVKVM